MTDLRVELAEANARIRELVAMNRTAVLRRDLGIPAAQARILATLYEANGDLVSHKAIRAAAAGDPLFPGEDRSLTKVYVCQLRKTLEPGAIEGVWGRGYALSPSGLAEIDELFGDVIGRAA